MVRKIHGLFKFSFLCFELGIFSSLTRGHHFFVFDFNFYDFKHNIFKQCNDLCILCDSGVGFPVKYSKVIVIVYALIEL